MSGTDEWRKALADLHKQQRRDRWKRKKDILGQAGPGMIRKPPPTDTATSGKRQRRGSEDRA